MDQQAQRGRSPSGTHHQPHISQSHSQSPASYPPSEQSIGLGLGLDQSAQQSFSDAANTAFDSFSANGFLDSQQAQAQTQQQSFPTLGSVAAADPAIFDPNNSFGQPAPPTGSDTTLSFSTSPQPAFLSPNLNEGGDFSLFPSGGQTDQYNAPLFDQGLNPNDISSMASPQTHSSPTPPHLFQPDGNQPGSAQHSPAFNQQHFSSPPGGHSRHTSLGPEAAYLQSQMNEWSQPQFQGHRRTPSEYSDVSSVAPSPNLVNADSFDPDPARHSPLQQASDGGLYQEVLGIGSFSISDSQAGGVGQQGRSPSHSPAISPRILPQQMPDMSQQQGFGLAPQNPYGGTYPGIPSSMEAFPSLASTGGPDMSQMAPPAINIDFAPTNSKPGAFDQQKSQLDQDSLTPPDRGRPRSRPRAVTDPFNSGGGMLNRPGNSNSLSPSLGSDLLSRSDASRSLSPLDRQATASPSRRRQSTSAVPNNVIALRLADPEYQNSQESGASKRVQKHPATFQCTLCPKRFTRAYNLRSHLRTHTDERPFVCTVCGKAFARQHDRKRHESLHSGEKKFVCKGDLKVGGQWGCGRRFARADALGRHFRSEAGRICIKPLLDEEMVERQRVWQEQRMQQNMAQNMAAPMMAMDPSAAYPMDASGNYVLPAALIAQYPALAQMNWSGTDMGGMDDDYSGRSSFDASDIDDPEDGGYVSGPGTGFGEGGMNQNFGDMGYTSDYGGQ